MNVNEFVTLVRGSFPELTPGQESMFRAMEPLYNDWNARINVISRKDIDSLYIRHVLHSLAIAQYLKTMRPEIFETWRIPGACLISEQEAVFREYRLPCCFRK